MHITCVHTLSMFQMDTKSKMRQSRFAFGVPWEIDDDIPRPTVSRQRALWQAVKLSSLGTMSFGQKNLSWTPFTPMANFGVRPSEIWRRTLRRRQQRAMIKTTSVRLLLTRCATGSSSRRVTAVFSRWNIK